MAIAVLRTYASPASPSLSAIPWSAAPARPRRAYAASTDGSVRRSGGVGEPSMSTNSATAAAGRAPSDSALITVFHMKELGLGWCLTMRSA